MNATKRLSDALIYDIMMTFESWHFWIRWDTKQMLCFMLLKRYHQYTKKIQEDTSSPTIIVHIMYTVLLLPLEPRIWQKNLMPPAGYDQQKNLDKHIFPRHWLSMDSWDFPQHFEWATSLNLWVGGGYSAYIKWYHRTHGHVTFHHCFNQELLRNNFLELV